MTTTEYTDLVVQWQPDPGRDRTYRYLIGACIAVVVIIGLVLSLVEVPERERLTREQIPERVARFIDERPKPEPVEPEPEPERKPPPVVEPEPVVQRERPEVEQREPLTEEQQEAREVAEQSGLLAMRQELDTLMDTSDVDAMINTQGSASTEGADVAAGYGDSDLAGAASRAGAAEGEGVSVEVGQSSLSRREVAALDVPEEKRGGEAEGETSRRGSFDETGRSDEEVSLVFDQNKGALYSLYNRARRQTPGLQGRLVVEVTIEPSGEVSEVEILSSELDSPSLEQRIRMRILQFQFEQKQAETITIIYPIEFLPS